MFHRLPKVSVSSPPRQTGRSRNCVQRRPPSRAPRPSSPGSPQSCCFGRDFWQRSCSPRFFWACFCSGIIWANECLFNLNSGSSPLLQSLAPQAINYRRRQRHRASLFGCRRPPWPKRVFGHARPSVEASARTHHAA